MVYPASDSKSHRLVLHTRYFYFAMQIHVAGFGAKVCRWYRENTIQAVARHKGFAYHTVEPGAAQIESLALKRLRVTSFVQAQRATEQYTSAISPLDRSIHATPERW